MISFGCFLMTSRTGAFSIFFLVQDFLEYRRLEDAEPDPQANSDQDNRERERYAPAPGQEVIAGPGAESQDREIRQQQATWHAELRPGRNQPALVLRARPFHRQQHRATPLAADANALDHPKDGQQNRAPDANRGVGRYESDGEGRQAHAHKRGDERRLAANAIAVMAEDRRADWPSDKADKIRSERRKRPRQRRLVREVELTEDQSRRRAVKKKIVPFDRRADR